MTWRNDTHHFQEYLRARHEISESLIVHQLVLHSLANGRLSGLPGTQLVFLRNAYTKSKQVIYRVKREQKNKKSMSMDDEGKKTAEDEYRMYREVRFVSDWSVTSQWAR